MVIGNMEEPLSADRERRRDLLPDFHAKLVEMEPPRSPRNPLSQESKKAMLKMFIPLVTVLLAYFIYCMVDAYGGGTQPGTHKLRIRNDTSFVLANGSSYCGEIHLASGLSDKQDSFYFYNFSKIETDDFHMTSTPLGVILDLPSSHIVEMRLMPPKFPTPADFGGKMNILVSNPSGRRMYFEELWFNTGYWKDGDMLRDFSTEDNRIVLGEYENDTARMYVPSAYSRNSVTPVWVLDMQGLRKAENLIEFYPDGRVFNLNPLLVRNFEGEKIDLQGAEFTGILAVESESKLRIDTNHCNVSKMLVNQDSTVHLRNFSSLVQEFKHQPSLFGVVGEFDEDFYEREFMIVEEPNVSIRVISDISMLLEEKDGVISLTSHQHDELLGLESYFLVFEDGSCVVESASLDEMDYNILCSFANTRNFPSM